MSDIQDWIDNINQHRTSARSAPIVGRVSQCVLAWQQVLAAIAAAGTVTSVGLALPSNEFTVTGSPVTTAGTLAGAWKSQLANLVLASPNAAPGTPAFRALVAGDIPSLAATYLPLAGGTMSGAIALPNGSAAAPELAFNTNYGIFYDATNNAVAIGNAGNQIGYFMPTGYLQSIAGGGVSNTQIMGEGGVSSTILRASTDTVEASFNTRKARGTIAAPAVPVLGDNLGSYNSAGYNGTTGYVTSGRVRTQLTETGAVSATAMGSQILFSTCPIGSGTLVEIGRMNNESGLSMFGANPVIDQNRLHRLRSFTVATLPTFIAGALAYITDATLTAITGLGLAPIGGGANQVPVYADNVGWKIL
jgi:hypothetical protein